MNPTAIVQARIGSTRLPGKVLKKILGKPMLQLQIERVKQATTLDQVVIATTTKTADYPIVRLSSKLGIPIFRGSETDVLARFYHCAKKYHANPIVRLTGDCPLIDPKIIDKTFRKFCATKADYASNHHVRSFPVGMDVEIFKFYALKLAWKKATSVYDREHVTSYLYNPANKFSLAEVFAPKKHNDPHLRLTVDEPADLKLITAIFQALYKTKPNFSLTDILKLIKNQPQIARLNREVKQKPTKYYKVKLSTKY